MSAGAENIQVRNAVPLVCSPDSAAEMGRRPDRRAQAWLKLRVFAGGGCGSGFQYGFTFD